jgi:hypothetical protein
MSTDLEVLEYLQDCCKSEDDAIKARDLCELFNLTDRQLRNVVNGLRRDGQAVCSSSHGYWYSTEPEDVWKTIRRMQGQVDDMTLSITGLKQAIQEDTGNAQFE